MRVIICAIILLTSQFAMAQNTVKDFVANYEGTRSFFLYQSTLRSFNDKTSDGFNKLIKDVEKISIYILPQATVEASSIQSFINSIEQQGFKEIKSISKRAEGVYFYTLNDKSNPKTIGIFRNDEMAGIVQLEGEIDMKHVASLKEINPEKVSSFFGFEQLKEEYENAKIEGDE